MTVLKSLKAIRPLRLAKSSFLRDTAESLVNSIGPLCNASLIDFFFVYVFGILGVQLFCGKMSECVVEKYHSKVECLKHGH